MKLTYRLATQEDLVEIVRLLLEDELGAERENLHLPLTDSYQAAFEAITADRNQELTVVERAGEIVATYQLSFIPYLTYQGGLRAQVEAVRVKASYRGQGLGTTIFHQVIERAKSKGAHLLQLTTDKKRAKAKKFYDALGFVASHEGMKLHLR